MPNAVRTGFGATQNIAPYFCVCIATHEIVPLLNRMSNSIIIKGLLTLSSWTPSPKKTPHNIFCYVLTTPKVISGQVPTYDSAHSLRLHSVVPMGNQDASTMTWYPTQSHYLDTEPTSPYTILLIPNAWLGSDKYEFKNHWFDSTRVRTCEVSGRSDSPIYQKRETDAPFIRPSCRASIWSPVRLDNVPEHWCGLCERALCSLW